MCRPRIADRSPWCNAVPSCSAHTVHHSKRRLELLRNSVPDYWQPFEHHCCFTCLWRTSEEVWGASKALKGTFKCESTAVYHATCVSLAYYRIVGNTESLKRIQDTIHRMRNVWLLSTYIIYGYGGYRRISSTTSQTQLKRLYLTHHLCVRLLLPLSI